MATRNRIRNVEYDHVQRSLIWKSSPQKAHQRPVKSTMGHDHLWGIIESNQKASMCSPPVRTRGKKHYYGGVGASSEETPYGHALTQPVTHRYSKKQVGLPERYNKGKPGKRIGYGNTAQKMSSAEQRRLNPSGRPASSRDQPDYSQRREHLWASDNDAARAEKPRDEDTKMGKTSIIRLNRSQRSQLFTNANPRNAVGSRRKVMVGAAHRDQIILRDTSAVAPGGVVSGGFSSRVKKEAPHLHSSAALAWGPTRRGTDPFSGPHVSSMKLNSKGMYYKNASQISSW